jgi:hypothetical protein
MYAWLYPLRHLLNAHNTYSATSLPHSCSFCPDSRHALSCAHTVAVAASAAGIDVTAHFNGFVQMCLLSKHAPPEHTRNVSKSLAEWDRFV